MVEATLGIQSDGCAVMSTPLREPWSGNQTWGQMVKEKSWELRCAAQSRREGRRRDGVKGYNSRLLKIGIMDQFIIHVDY